MSTALTPKSPREFPTVMHPTDGESYLWSGPIRMTLTQLADRTDYLSGRLVKTTISYSGATPTNNQWTSVVTLSAGTLDVGSQVAFMCPVQDGTSCLFRCVVSDDIAMYDGGGLYTMIEASGTGYEIWMHTVVRRATHTLALQYYPTVYSGSMPGAAMIWIVRK